MEVVALSWPTPFGLLTPGVLGSVAADGWCLGEVALLFSMSRPAPADAGVPFAGSVPRMVWTVAAAYLTIGLLLITGQVQRWLRWARRRCEQRVAEQRDKDRRPNRTETAKA